MTRKIILWCPDFFNYDDLIKNELERSGYKVFLISDRPFKNKILRALTTRFPSFFSMILIPYYLRLLVRERSQYDDFFVINGQTLSLFMIKYLKNKYKFTSTRLYFWDSIKNRPTGIKLISEFQKTYSFDRQDCDLYNLRYRPLFYDTKYTSTNQGQNKQAFTSDLVFIGTDHKDRTDIISKIAQSHDINFEAEVYFHTRLVFFIKRFVLRWVNLASNYKRIYKPKSLFEIIAMYEKSKAVLDIHHPLQTGLTMRTIELVGMQKKIVTTNQNVRLERFYNEDMVHVINRDDPIIPDSFLHGSRNAGFSPEVLHYYSLPAFLNEILSNDL
jgi:hypothetical protein